MGRGLLCAPEEAKRLKKAKQSNSRRLPRFKLRRKLRSRGLPLIEELSVNIVAAFRVGIMSALGAAKGPVRTAPAMVNVD
jgi:hypothetical protein